MLENRKEPVGDDVFLDVPIECGAQEEEVGRFSNISLFMLLLRLTRRTLAQRSEPLSSYVVGDLMTPAFSPTPRSWAEQGDDRGFTPAVFETRLDRRRGAL